MVCEGDRDRGQRTEPQRVLKHKEACPGRRGAEGGTWESSESTSQRRGGGREEGEGGRGSRREGGRSGTGNGEGLVLVRAPRTQEG